MSDDSFGLWIDGVCQSECDAVILSNPIVDVEYLHSIEDVLFGNGEYLPCLVRRYCEGDYYNSGLFDEFESRVLESRRFSLVEQLDEFVEWVKEHQEYNDLLLVDVYDDVQKQIKKIKEDYSMIKG